MDNNRRCVLLMRIPFNNEKSESATDNFFSQVVEILKGKKYLISAEIAIYNKYIWFFLTCPAIIKNTIKGQWYAQYPEAEIEEVGDYITKLLTGYNARHVMGYEMYLDKTEFIPFKTYKTLEKNPLVSFSGIANSFNTDDIGIIQLILQPQEKDNLWNKMIKGRRERSRDQSISSHPSDKIPEYLLLEQEKDNRAYFKTSIRFIAFGKDTNRVSLNLSTMTALYKKILEQPGLQSLKESHLHSDNNFTKAIVKRELGHKIIRLGTDEIATIFHLPYQKEEIAQIVQIRSKRAPSPQNLPTTGDLSLFGTTNYQNQKNAFGIKTADRRRHLYVIGKTGMGKSKMLELLMKADIEQERGIILLDPHGDLAREVINYIPENRIKDTIYFDPADIDYPIGFNPMEGVGAYEFKQNIVAGFISIFKKMFGLNWNQRFEHVLRYTTLALLEYPNASILGIPRMLTDNIFRQEVISFITDPLVKKFWATEFASWNDQFANEAIVPIINKIGQFVANPLIRHIVGQAKSGFSLEDVMNKEKILIINLSMGKLGEENAALLGSMFVTKIWQAALSRTKMLEEERKDTFMYVDEFQNFATLTFGNILSEARKYRLNLTVAHQFMQQLPSEVRATVFGNVGNLISFRVGGDDAQILVKEFEPVFNVNDFLNLDSRNFLIKMSIDGQTVKPFSAQTLNLEKASQNQIDLVINSSRKLYAKTRKEVEAEMLMWEKGEVYSNKPVALIKEEMFPEPII